jgi:hypothetical protein
MICSIPLPLPSLYERQLSRRSQQKWNDFVEKLSKIRRSLEVLYRRATWLNDKEGSFGLMEAICNSLLRLTECWVEVIRWCLQNPAGIIALIPKMSAIVTMALDRVALELWVKLREEYEKTLKDVDRENIYLSEFVAINTKSNAYLKQSDLRDTTDFPQNNLPYPEYCGFYGREDILKQLEVALVPTQSSRGIQSVLLYGLGGVGKSQTALAFAHRNSSSFDAIFWVRSETKSSLKGSFTDIALTLHLAKARGECHDEENLLYSQAWLKQAADRFGAWQILHSIPCLYS